MNATAKNSSKNTDAPLSYVESRHVTLLTGWFAAPTNAASSYQRVRYLCSSAATSAPRVCATATSSTCVS